MHPERTSASARPACPPPLLPPKTRPPQALAAAEAVSGAGGPRVALVLLLTAQLYSRTGRVTLAEGLYREAAKMVQLSPRSAGKRGVQGWAAAVWWRGGRARGGRTSRCSVSG